jgi:hypothetical protein
MKTLSFRQKRILEKIGLLALVLLFITSVLWFISNTAQQYRQGALRSRYHHSQSTQAPMNVSIIEPWMTFNYLNIVFKLPPHYLENSLSITESRYPNIRIDYYARRHTINQQMFLQMIRQNITNYNATVSQ